MSTVTSTKPIAFSRHVREIFIFLIVLVAASNVSGIFLLDRIVRSEDSRVAAQLTSALDLVQRHQAPTLTGKIAPADMATLTRETELRDLIIAYAPADGNSGRWSVLRSSGEPQTDVESAQLAGVPQLPESGWGADGEYWRYQSLRATLNGQSVVMCAGVTAPGLGELKSQFRLELWVRSFIVAAFVLFALLFHRIVLLPFRDMRQRASALVSSGLLPEAPGQPTDDPEYVISTFDVLVRRLIEEADTNREQAVKSEKRARNVERFNEYMLSSMSTGVLILGQDGTILRANRAAEQTLRTQVSAMTGIGYREAGLYPEMMAVVEEGLRHGQLYARREMRIERDGDEGPLYLGVNTSLIRNDFDEVVGLSILMTDLTEIKRLYDNLAENQRLADLGEMAAGLAHQLRNSMAAILGYGKLLKDMTGPDARSGGWVDSVIGETQETAQMLERFLSFARPLTRDREPVDLEGTIREAISTIDGLAREANVRVTLQTHSSNVMNYNVMGDSLLLKQVFVNLIQNGIEAMARPGKITLSISPSVLPSGDPSRVALMGNPTQSNARLAGGLERGTFFRIDVADQGTGIPENDRARIFRPFFTSKESGTGLGLPLAKKIAVFHGGNLTLERSGPEGSVFVVMLPAVGAVEPHETELNRRETVGTART